MSFESRLGNRGKHRARVEASAGDYEPIRRCEICGIRVIKKIKYCGRVCRGNAKSSKWRELYQQVRKANGAWVSVQCSSAIEAGRLQSLAQAKTEFLASRDGLTVSIKARPA
jgi:hypothetical protein